MKLTQAGKQENDTDGWDKKTYPKEFLKQLGVKHVARAAGRFSEVEADLITWVRSESRTLKTQKETTF